MVRVVIVFFFCIAGIDLSVASRIALFGRLGIVSNVVVLLRYVSNVVIDMF